jgi:hypothetical protein
LRSGLHCFCKVHPFYLFAPDRPPPPRLRPSPPPSPAQSGTGDWNPPPEHAHQICADPEVSPPASQRRRSNDGSQVDVPASAPVFRRRLCSRIAASGNVNASPPTLLPQPRAPRGSTVCLWIPRRLGSTPLCPGHHLLLARQAEEDTVPPPYLDNDIEAPPLQQLPLPSSPSQQDPELQHDPLTHESELQFGLLAGTVTWGPPQQVEVSGSILGGMSQVGTQIPVDYFITQPLRTCFAILPASLLAAAWDMRLHSMRRFWVDYLLPARPPTSTTPRARSLLDRFWRKCLLMLLLTLSSTGLLWIALLKGSRCRLEGG